MVVGFFDRRVFRGTRMQISTITRPPSAQLPVAFYVLNCARGTFDVEIEKFLQEISAGMLELTRTTRNLSRQVKLGSAKNATVLVEKFERRLVRLVWSQRVMRATPPVERFRIVPSKSFSR